MIIGEFEEVKRYGPDNLTLANSHLPDNLHHCPVHAPLTVYVECPFNSHAQLISTNFPHICTVRIIRAVLCP